MTATMTWDERRNFHLELARIHLKNSQNALDRCIRKHNTVDWNEYKAEYKLHNKHWGIAQAMFTRRYGK